MKTPTNIDVLIVGAGPAGLTAALYAGRRGLKTVVVSQDLGGQAALTDVIENYPGTLHIEGPDLMENFRKHAELYGARIIFDAITEVERVGEEFLVRTREGMFQAKAIILAFGLTPRDLDVASEAQFRGKGIYWNATEDGLQFKDKIVAVVGGGNSALTAAEFLGHIAQKVYLIHRRDEFRGEKIIEERVRALPNVELILNAEVKDVLGEDSLTGIRVQVNGGANPRDIAVDGVFVAIGYRAKTEFVANLVDRNDHGELLGILGQQTKTPGVFVCGDVTNLGYKQVVVSAGEGCKAALEAYRYIQMKSGGRGLVAPDWS